MGSMSFPYLGNVPILPFRIIIRCQNDACIVSLNNFGKILRCWTLIRRFYVINFSEILLKKFDLVLLFIRLQNYTIYHTTVCVNHLILQQCAWYLIVLRTILL